MAAVNDLLHDECMIVGEIGFCLDMELVKFNGKMEEGKGLIHPSHPPPTKEGECHVENLLKQALYWISAGNFFFF